MDILVCIKQVPGTTKVEVDPVTGVLKRDGVDSKMNPYDYVLATAYAISEGIKKLGAFDLILCGKQTTDGDTAQVGPEAAEYLGIPHIANVLRIAEVKEESIRVEMDMGSIIQQAEVQFPCLLTVEKGIVQPRLPSYRKKISTKDRGIQMITLEDFDDRDEKNYGLNGSPTQVERIFPPEVNSNRELWTGSGEALSRKMAAKLKQLKFI